MGTRLDIVGETPNSLASLQRAPIGDNPTQTLEMGNLRDPDTRTGPAPGGQARGDSVCLERLVMAMTEERLCILERFGSTDMQDLASAYRVLKAERDALKAECERLKREGAMRSTRLGQFADGAAALDRDYKAAREEVAELTFQLGRVCIERDEARAECEQVSKVMADLNDGCVAYEKELARIRPVYDAACAWWDVANVASEDDARQFWHRQKVLQHAIDLARSSTGKDGGDESH